MRRRINVTIKNFFLLAILALIFTTNPSPAKAATDKWRHPGVVFRLWDYQNQNYAQTCPSCGPMGGIHVLSWYQLNPGPGSYNFDRITSFLNQAKSMQTAPFPDGHTIPKPVVIEISVSMSGANDSTPAWVYDSGVVRKAYNCNGTQIAVPNYADSAWQNAYFAFIKALGEYFDSKTKDYPNLAGFIFGTGYDDEAYPVPGYCKTGFPDGYRFQQWIRGIGSTAGKYFHNIPVYLPSGMAGENWFVLEAAQANGLGVKTNTINPGGEATAMSWAGPDQPSTSLPWSAAIVTGDTVSWAFEDARFFPYKGGIAAYLQLLMIMSFKGDWMDFRDVAAFSTLGDAYPYATKVFVPTYLGQTKARTPGVWIAFRDLRDPAIEINSMGETHVKGDLGFYLKRVNDSGSSKVFTENFPSPAQNQVYGFGRLLPVGKYMSLKLDDGVWFKSGTRDINLRLVLLNSGSGNVEVEFKKGDGSSYKEVFTKGSSLGDTDKFLEITRKINGIKFDGSFSGGGDIVIRANGDQSIIHMLEIRATGNIPTGSSGGSNSTGGSNASGGSSGGWTSGSGTTGGSNNGWTGGSGTSGGTGISGGSGAPGGSNNNSSNPTGSSSSSGNNTSTSFTTGWNYTNWRAWWPTRFDDLPSICPYVVYNSQNWFYTYVRNFSTSERFNVGQYYYIYCQSPVNWP